MPLNVALPIYGPTMSQHCRLTIERGTPTTAVNVSLPDNPKIDAVARYLHGGHLREAADLSADAELLLQAEDGRPFRGRPRRLRAPAARAARPAPRLAAEPRELVPVAAGRRRHRGRGKRARGRPRGGGRARLRGGQARAPRLLGRAVTSSRLASASTRARRRRRSARTPTASTRRGDCSTARPRASWPFTDFDRVSLAFRGGQIDDPVDARRRRSRTSGPAAGGTSGSCSAVLRIDMLPGGNGDALWIEYGDAQSPRRILVDGGTKGSWDDPAGLRSRIEALPAGRAPLRAPRRHAHRRATTSTAPRAPARHAARRDVRRRLVQRLAAPPRHAASRSGRWRESSSPTRSWRRGFPGTTPSAAARSSCRPTGRCSRRRSPTS